MLDLDIPTHLDVLADAQGWRVGNTRPDLDRAEAILRRGMLDYPYALALGDELALVLERQGRDAEAEELVADLERRLGGAGVETLCRLAKLHKKRAEGHIAGHHWAAAERRLAEGERLYGTAFDRAFGFYPRINQLAMRYVRAGVAMAAGRRDDAAELLARTRHDAGRLLADGRAWVACLPDDNVWIPAAQGEANVLLGRWTEAEDAYARAVREAGGRKFHHDCMAGQLAALLLPTAVRLGEPAAGPLADPDAFFRTPAEAPA